jgi:hypothetical protein
MNTLSWLIYLTDVIPSMGVMFGVFGLIMLLVSGFALLPYSFEMEHAREPTTMMKGIKRMWRWFLPFGFICVFLANVVPGTNTMRLILASELVETVITNPEVIEVFDLLKDKLKEELEGGD